MCISYSLGVAMFISRYTSHTDQMFATVRKNKADNLAIWSGALDVIGLYYIKNLDFQKFDKLKLKI